MADRRDVIHQRHTAQAGCGLEEALHRLIIRAEAIGQTIEDTALDVLDSIIRFDP